MSWGLKTIHVPGDLISISRFNGNLTDQPPRSTIYCPSELTLKCIHRFFLTSYWQESGKEVRWRTLLLYYQLQSKLWYSYFWSGSVVYAFNLVDSRVFWYLGGMVGGRSMYSTYSGLNLYSVFMEKERSQWECDSETYIDHGCGLGYDVVRTFLGSLGFGLSRLCWYLIP